MYFENKEKSSRSAIVWSYYLLGVCLISFTAALLVETTYGRKKEGEYITL